MSIKLVDTLESMGNFPVALAESIECADGTDLETKLSTLGTGGGAEAFVQLSQDEYDALPDDETGKLDGREYRTYDTGHIYQLGVEFGKETDISGKQDNLNKVKFTVRRNGVNDPRYCLIGSSDLSQTLLMNEPYKFEGVFGSNNSVDKKSIINLSVSFKNGADKDNIFRGYADCANGFEYVDLMITVDETANRAYAYVDFKQEATLATGNITVPSINTEYYMDFEEEFVLTNDVLGVELCRMSDYCKVITEISDEVSDSTVWSSKKTSDKIDGLISDTSSSTTNTYSSAKIDEKIEKHSLPLVFDSGVRVNATIEIYKLSNVTYKATGDEHPYNLNLLLSTRAGEEIELFGGKSDSGWKLFARKNNDYSSKIMDVYLDGYDVYVRLATYYNFFKVYHKNGALRSDFAVTKVTSIPDTATEIPITAPGVMDDLTSTESTWSSSKIASEINPTIDRTDLLPSNELDLNLLYNRCGTGVYDIVGQGSAGHGMIRVDLWTINNGTICYIVSIMYSDGSSSTVGGNINAQPTVPINSKWMSVINKLTKIGYL